jgi:hypothetical protein
MRIRHVPELRQSDQVLAPLLVGMIRPAVIIPRGIEADRLNMMLAHELAHVKRRDLAWGWLPALCHVLFFFHPLLWLTRRESLLAQEMACDELALRHTGASPAAYGNMLVDFIAANMPRRAFGALGICETPRNLKRRIIAMKTIDLKNRALMIVLAGIAVTAMLPWRIVAQDKPDDAARRIQQLEKENAQLREALEKTKAPAAHDPLTPEIVAAEAELAGLRAKYISEHSTVRAAEARLKRLKDLHAAQQSRPRAASPKAVRERELYMEELALAQGYANSVRKLRENGLASHEEVVRAQRQVFQVQREMAKAVDDRAQLREVLEEELAAVQMLLKEIRKLIEVGHAAAGADLDLQREVLKLRRELLTLE